MDPCHVFIDESGDFGFSAHSSRYVVLAAILTTEINRLSRIPRKIASHNPMRQRNRINTELKFNNAYDSTKRRLLREVAELNATRIGYIVLDKARFRKEGVNYGESMYLQMCDLLVTEIIRHERSMRRFDIIFHRSPFHHGKIERFEGTISAAMEKESSRLRIIPPDILIHVKSSEECVCLRVADFIAGTIHRRYVSNEDCFYDIIKNMVAFRKSFT